MDRSHWENHEITHAGATINAFEPEYSGGVVLDHDDPSTVYLLGRREPDRGVWSVGPLATMAGRGRM